MLRRTTLKCPTCGHDPLYSAHRDRQSPVQYYMCGGCDGAFEHPLSPPEPEPADEAETQNTTDAEAAPAAV